VRTHKLSKSTGRQSLLLSIFYINSNTVAIRSGGVVVVVVVVSGGCGGGGGGSGGGGGGDGGGGASTHPSLTLFRHSHDFISVVWCEVAS
jgi:hypothetical protein